MLKRDKIGQDIAIFLLAAIMGIFILMIILWVLSGYYPALIPATVGFVQGGSDLIKLITGSLIAGIVGIITAIYSMKLKEDEDKEKILLGLYYEIQSLKQFFESLSITQKGIILIIPSYWPDLRLKENIYSNYGLFFVFRKELFTLDSELLEQLLKFYSNIIFINDCQIIIKQNFPKVDMLDTDELERRIVETKNQIDHILKLILDRQDRVKSA